MKLNKKALEDAYQLSGEIQDIERQISDMELRVGKNYVGDSVKDYRSGHGIPIKIQGYGHSQKDYNRQQKLYRTLKSKRDLLIQRKIEIEDALESIGEPTIRRIIRLRYFDRLSWDAVAIAVDGTKSSDAMRKRLERYLEN